MSFHRRYHCGVLAHAVALVLGVFCFVVYPSVLCVDILCSPFICWKSGKDLFLFWFVVPPTLLLLLFPGVDVPAFVLACNCLGSSNKWK